MIALIRLFILCVLSRGRICVIIERAEILISERLKLLLEKC